MKNRLVWVAGVALIAGGVAVAQSSNQGTGTMDSQTGSSTASTPQSGSHTDAQGDLPASKEGESQSGKASHADKTSERPGAMGAPETPDAGPTPRGETPATGAQTEKKGSSTDNNSRPGVDPGSAPPTGSGETGTTPKNMSSDSSSSSPSYAKPIDSTTNTTNSQPSQQVSGNGTKSPDR